MTYFCGEYATAINCNSFNECIPKCTQHSLWLLIFIIISLIIIMIVLNKRKEIN
jgi:hypothetical protein